MKLHEACNAAMFLVNACYFFKVPIEVCSECLNLLARKGEGVDEIEVPGEVRKLILDAEKLAASRRCRYEILEDKLIIKFMDNVTPTASTHVVSDIKFSSYGFLLITINAPAGSSYAIYMDGFQAYNTYGRWFGEGTEEFKKIMNFIESRVLEGLSCVKDVIEGIGIKKKKRYEVCLVEGILYP